MTKSQREERDAAIMRAKQDKKNKINADKAAEAKKNAPAAGSGAGIVRASKVTGGGKK